VKAKRNIKTRKRGVGWASGAGRGQRPSLARRVSKDRHRYGHVSNPSVNRCNGSVRKAEVHWYEAHGIGKRKMKIKRLLD
jgi:hypothetical protein